MKWNPLEWMWLKSALSKFSRASARGSFISNQPVRPEVNDKVLVKHYQSWAYTCATKNATFVASTPLRLYATRAANEPKSRQAARTLTKAETMDLAERNPRIASSSRFKSATEVQEILVHPFLKLMETINEWRDQFETFEETQLFMDITGDSYWLLGFNSLGIPERVYLLPSQYTEIVPHQTEFIRGYLYGIQPQNKVKFQPDEIVHFRTPNPGDQYYGMGCLEAAFRAVIQYESMEDYETALNQNLGIPGLFISYDGDLQNDQIADLEARWNKALAGVAKSGKVKVGTGKMTVHEIGNTPREMGFVQGRKWTRDEICAAFGVPVDLVANDNSNRATSLIAFNTYMTTGILPRLTRIENKLNADIMPFYNEPRLFCAFDDPRVESEETKVENAVNLVSANIIAISEARAKFGLPPKSAEEIRNENQGEANGLVPQQVAGGTDGQPADPTADQ